MKAFVCSFEELREPSLGHVHIVDILASSANVQCMLAVFMERRRRMWAWLGRFLRMVKQRGIEAMRDDEEEMEEDEED